MNAATLTILMVIVLFVLLLLNVPVAFALAATGLGFMLLQNGHAALYMIASSSWTGWTDFMLTAIPLFVLMAAFLERSGVAEDLYEAVYRWFGGIPGGLAMGTVLICAVFAAMSGTSALGTLTMGVIALPSMMKRKYDSKMVIGAVAAGGTMGSLIPPSMTMIYYGYLTGTSVGKMFMGGVLPGILLTLLIMGYIGIKCLINPKAGPVIPQEQRFTMKEKIASLKSVVLPVLIILVVLGSIYSGVCTATEAAGLGAFGAFLTTIIYRRLTWKVVKDSVLATVRITAMVGWLTLGAKLFSQAFVALGAQKLVIDLFSNIAISKWVVLAVMMIILLILGCFMDGLGIMIITLPVFMPLLQKFDFNPLWFGILFVINMEMGYLTPPFGLNLFYMRMLTPKSVTMTDIYKSGLPYLVCMLAVLLLVILIPGLATWLPNSMG